MGTDKRIEKRIACWDISANIDSSGSAQEVKITNINRLGACINIKIDSDNLINVTLFRKADESSYYLKERECRIIEHEGESHTGIEFVDKLDTEEINILTLPKKYSKEFNQ
ncbi:MAG: hypothetical protein JW806_01455 [Sedimentisphaerales bacterium]|nr:hypothetical protein [Sedimentisphaerales bacterium]